MYNFQSGFRPNHSANLRLAHLTHKVLKGFDEGLLIGMIRIDLQKEFGAINHEVLLQKVKASRFLEQNVQWFRPYLCDRIFWVENENKLSDFGMISCGVPQGSILGPHLFLIYVNDMPQAVKSNLLLYPDDSCLIYQHKDIAIIEKNLNDDFENICDWFVNNKLSIHFGDDRTKLILFASTRRAENIPKLNIRYKEINIKQQAQVTYLGCVLDDSMSGETMALKFVNKINGKVKFLYRKNKFLTSELRRMLCNALIQPHFDYACTAWYPNLTEKTKKNIQNMQNTKCIRFCLRLDKMQHIFLTEFRSINWLSTKERVHQCINTITPNFVNKNCPFYLNEIFEFASHCIRDTRNSFAKLKHPFPKINTGQKTLSYIVSLCGAIYPKPLKNE